MMMICKLDGVVNLIHQVGTYKQNNLGVLYITELFLVIHMVNAADGCW